MDLSKITCTDIPCPPPEEATLADTIKKMVAYVARNGPDFEEKVKLKEANNPMFSFLYDTTSDTYGFYRWQLFCAKQQVSLLKMILSSLFLIQYL